MKYFKPTHSHPDAQSRRIVSEGDLNTIEGDIMKNYIGSDGRKQHEVKRVIAEHTVQNLLPFDFFAI